MSDPSQALSAEYSAKASAYAELWAPVLRPMARPLLGALPLADARLVLDVGTGTGALVAAMAPLAPQALLLGVDNALGMLRLARQGAAGLVAVMDARCLALPAGMVDVATAAFMLFHVPDPKVALGELRRVLRPGGVLGLITWGQDPGTPGLEAWNDELDAAGAGPDVRDRSVMQQEMMDSPAKLATLLSSAGFSELRIWAEWHSRQWAPDDLATLQAACGMPARRLRNLPPAERRACAERVRRRLAELSDSERTYHAEVLYAVAAVGHGPGVKEGA